MKTIPNVKIQMIRKLSEEQPHLTNRQIAEIVDVGYGTVLKYRQHKTKPKKICCLSDECTNWFYPTDPNQTYCCLECRDSSYKKRHPNEAKYPPRAKRDRGLVLQEYTNKLNKVWRLIA